jgi:hypothetical protein
LEDNVTSQVGTMVIAPAKQGCQPILGPPIGQQQPRAPQPTGQQQQPRVPQPTGQLQQLPQQHAQLSPFGGRFPMQSMIGQVHPMRPCQPNMQQQAMTMVPLQAPPTMQPIMQRPPIVQLPPPMGQVYWARQHQPPATFPYPQVNKCD